MEEEGKPVDGIGLTVAGKNKRPYEQPLLKRFGSVKMLTTGGSGPNDEGSAPPAGPVTACTPPTSTSHPFCYSDRRLKENIVEVGAHPLGVGRYLFDFKSAFSQTCGHGRQFGVMADEVERVLPEAVRTHPDDYKMVDYNMLGIDRVLVGAPASIRP